MMHKIIFFCVFFFQIHFVICAQDDTYYEETYEDVIVDPEESDEVEELSPERQRETYGVEELSYDGPLDEKYNGKDFDYTEDPPEPPKVTNNNWFASIFQAIAAFFANIGSALMYILLAIAALLIVYLLAKSIFGVNLARMNRVQKKKLAENSKSIIDEEDTEDISENDFSRLAEKAENEGNYRLAFRYQFLEILQRLNFRKYIEWQKDKTNLEYIPEIKNESVKSEYQKLANYFNYIWYGERPLNQSEYMESKAEINQLKSSL